MPPVYGLYTAFLPALCYTFFGSSNEIAVGPVAMVSLTLPSVLAGLAEPGTDLYIQGAMVVTLRTNILALLLLLLLFCSSTHPCVFVVSGALFLLLGLLRMGFLVENLINHSTMMGFTQVRERFARGCSFVFRGNGPFPPWVS
jgi:MFS superfamily sulfate permease-like transporter